MPEMSNIKKFVKSLQTGRTNTTKALDALNFGAHLGNLTNPGVLDGPSAPMKAALQPPLTDAEIAHIDSWPDDQKEQVRQALVTAAQANRQVRFFWELHGGPKEETDIQGLAGAGTITIIFRSPRSKIRVSATTFGDITVDV